MSNERFEILGYEELDRWYAIVLHVCNDKPIYVYYVPSDKPNLEEPSNEPD